MQKKHWPNSIPFYDKNSGDRRNHLNKIKPAYEKHRANFTLIGNKLKAFSLNQEQGKDTHFCHFYLTSHESPSQRNQRRKKLKIQIVKEDVKLSLITDNMILCVENLKDSTHKKLFELNT